MCLARHPEAAYLTFGIQVTCMPAFLQTSFVDFRFHSRTFRVLVTFAATSLQLMSHLRWNWMMMPSYVVIGDSFQHCVVDRTMKRYGLG